MNKSELKRMLEQADVPQEMYNLDECGRDDEKFCMIQYGKKWNIFFSERGIKTTNESFETEEDACDFIYHQLID